MNKNFPTKEAYQLELPFTKSNFKNNAINQEIAELIIDDRISDNNLYWFNPYIPTKKWDKRPSKQFIVELWISKYDAEMIIVYATSKKVAQKYLKNKYLIGEFYELNDFPTQELNYEIFNKFNNYKNSKKESSNE